MRGVRACEKYEGYLIFLFGNTPIKTSQCNSNRSVFVRMLRYYVAT